MLRGMMRYNPLNTPIITFDCRLGRTPSYLFLLKSTGGKQPGILRYIRSISH